ncbi:DUF4148 domain-containing protein [Mycetohabitans sp. B46]|uniref:DUF4148 domain-containing protein n=1 Tax=Mycetohabitans sp. B46 TaxID=2772536 RepID=UPI003FCFC462
MLEAVPMLGSISTAARSLGLFYAVVAASVLAMPIASFAQANAPLTRTQVQAELAQLEKAGYQPGLASLYYPTDIQAAEARLAAQQTSPVGGVATGNSRSGAGNAAVSPREPANEVKLGLLRPVSAGRNRPTVFFPRTRLAFLRAVKAVLGHDR